MELAPASGNDATGCLIIAAVLTGWVRNSRHHRTRRKRRRQNPPTLIITPTTTTLRTRQ
jgi:hypothetical protein